MAASLGKMPTTIEGQEAFDPISAGDALSRPRRGAALELTVEALDRVCRVQLGAVLGREGHVGQDVGLGVVHWFGEVRQRPVPVLDICRMHGHRYRQPDRVRHQPVLATLELLAGIGAARPTGLPRKARRQVT